MNKSLQLTRRPVPFAALVAATLIPTVTYGFDDAKTDESKLTVDRIFGGNEFRSKSYSARWFDDRSYTRIELSNENNDQRGIVQYDSATGKSRVVVSAADLIPAGETTPLSIANYAWSKNRNLVLIFTNTKRVWRQNTRGDYWLLDRTSKQLRQLGGDSKPSTLMFAKISPAGQHVAYVHERNIYLEDLLDHSIRQLTRSSSDDVINGTTDWVYEEEFGLRDAFRWSPDGKSIAYWQINTEGVQRFPLLNNIDSLYPTVKWIPYPKVGQKNPDCRIGVVHCETGKTRWITLPGSSRDYYIPRINWLDNSRELLIQKMNRLQNTNRIFVADLSSGKTKLILTEHDDAWVDVHDELRWVEDGEMFTWLSERDGWRHIYLSSKTGGTLRQITKGNFDVIRLLEIDEQLKCAYFIASPESASERYLYHVKLDGSDLRRVTPLGFQGTHSYQISPGAHWAIYSRSSADLPPVTRLISLPDHESLRILEENKKLIGKLAQLKREPTEFFRVHIGDGVELEAWGIKPPDLDSNRHYPLLVYVYGEPAGTTVVNRWGGSSYLWHLMLAQHGYVVMSFDNRGTKAPRGRLWRKSIFKKIGILPPKDQAAAVRTILKERSYLDKGRVGIWGWSGGGSSSLQAIFKYPDLYQTAIAVAPVPNQRYYDTIYQERYMTLPGMNVEGYREGSAINFAKNLKGNLLLIHGTADDNCHYATMEMLIDELVSHNRQFSMMAYPNRTHSIRERKNTTRHLRELMTRYLLQNLPVNASSSATSE